ncbi:MAG: TonB-dependent receptor [Pseudomonadota bacterium]|nr:TonB-dependent receptor [Pseudomonadota bacterium]
MKQIKRKKLSGALVQALGAGVAVSVIVTAAHAQQAQRIEKIEVTGSNIKRVDQETVAPVEIITRDQIERTGQATVAEVLRNIPSNTGGSFGESFSNSFAPGAAGISLRGLGQKTTLVLLNGRRTAGYGFAQNLQDSFVDLNSIPSSAVERIEILKDGASAIYGSDAIAGVVNIILRKDFRGVELSAKAGYFEGKHDYRLNATAGWGDLARDRWSAFATLDYYKRDHLLLSETDFGASRDYRQYPGGRNFRSLTAGGTWRELTATGGLSSNHRASSECAQFGGVVLTGPQAVEQGLLGATSALALASNTFCSKDFNNQLSALPQTERIGLISRFTKEFSANATGYIDLGLSRVENFQTFTAPLWVTTALEPTAAGLRPFAFTANFAPGAAGNPFGNRARWVGNLQSFGTRDSELVSDTVRILAGLTFNVRGWDLDSAVGFSRNEIESNALNRTTKIGMSNALGIGSGPQPPVPLVTSSSINLDRQSTISADIRNSILANIKRESTSELKFVDTKASTELWRMGGGNAGLAIGAEFRNEKLSDRPDTLAATGQVLGQGITATEGERDNYAVYAEMSLPITRRIEASIAGRYDHYSDYGTSTTPKAGIKFKATDSLLFRANWGKGFRAPTLPEISPSVATFFVQVNDPVTGATNVQISGVFAGNPNLEPEESTSTTAGIVFEPNANFSMGVNYYRIDWTNIVLAPGFQGIVNGGDPTRVIRDPVTGNIVTVFNNYLNASKTLTSGWDLEARYRMTTGMGRWTTRANFSYVDSFFQDGVEYAGTNGQGTSTIPRVRGQVAMDLDVRGFSTTLAANYIRHYREDNLAPSFFTVGDPRFQNQVHPTNIPSYITYDLFAKYQLTRNLSISGSVVNLHNKLPFASPGYDATNIYDVSLYDVRGRQFRLGVTLKM